ncbi:DUF5681 domain-containing protein [Desulforhabdus sp. TSK]|uniref:DUF5681 domain-containing protein n=1 Tax=Desulforhabdus sp. TSK TaxID=2925014 RepID=UPI001FC8C432|nr:DUF5681 domain-containing protein [Desulforhabdus sp. TSK]GKT07781.1 hypothetical protein DSTSK_10860 [Desulforhabdus sp. TSK]
MEKPVKAGRKQDGTFAPGCSGNPRGKRPGTKHKVTLACEELLRGEAERITRVAIDRALEGDTVALKICLERFYPVPKDGPVKLSFPLVDSSLDLTSATGRIVKAAASGELTPSQAESMMRLFEMHLKVLGLTEIERRLQTLEQNMEAKK